MKIENTDAEQIERLNGRIAELLRERDEAKERGDRYHAENDVLFKRAVEAESRAGNAQEPLPAASPAIQHIRELFEKAPYLKDAEGSLPGAHPVTWRDLADLAALTSTDRTEPADDCSCGGGGISGHDALCPYAVTSTNDCGGK